MGQTPSGQSACRLCPASSPTTVTGAFGLLAPTTITHLPNPGSPVTNTANAAVCPVTDQRGYARNGQCDKGAAEFGGLAPAAILTKTYYFAGAQLIAMREITTTGLAGTLYYLHQDHLGSTSVATCGSGSCGAPGAVVSKQLFYPYGEVRWSTGTMPTTIGYTGQRADASTGLYFYNARYYSPYLNRFISADTIVPQIYNPQSLNRFTYVYNDPLIYIDPTGHEPCEYGTGLYCDNGTRNSNRYDKFERADVILQRLLSQQSAWIKLTKMERLILQDAGWDEETYTAEFINGNAIRISPPDIDFYHLDEEVLGNQYSPFLFSLASTASAEVQELVLNPMITSGDPRLASVAAAASLFNLAIGRGASFAGLVATKYQYDHKLYGTTKGDLDVTTTLTWAALLPGPQQVGLSWLGTLYTGFRTFGIIQPIDTYYQQLTGTPWPSSK